MDNMNTHSIQTHTHTHNVSAEQFSAPRDTSSVMVGKIAWNHHRSRYSPNGDAETRQVDAIILYRMYRNTSAKLQNVIL